jgi:cell division protein FtsB
MVPYKMVGMSTPVTKRPSPPRNQGSSLQIVFGSILAISLLLAINFSGRIAAGRQIETKRDDLMRAITTLEAQATALNSQLNYVSSDSFVNDWARREGRMVKGDEVLVVPVPGPSSGPKIAATPFVDTSIAETNDPEFKNWELWWQLFFDAPPPETR